MNKKLLICVIIVALLFAGCKKVSCPPKLPCDEDVVEIAKESNGGKCPLFEECVKNEQEEKERN